MAQLEWPTGSPGPPTSPADVGEGAPSVKAENTIASSPVRGWRNAEVEGPQSSWGLTWQERGLSEDLWDLVKKHKARSQLRLTDWVVAGNLSQFLVTFNSQALRLKGTPLIPLLLRFTDMGNGPFRTEPLIGFFLITEGRV